MNSFHPLLLTKIQKAIENRKDELHRSIGEVLSKAARIKKAALMKRLAPKMAKKRAIKAKRMKTGKELKVKAQKAAVNVIKAKLTKGQDMKALGIGAKERLEKMVKKKASVIKKIAKKLMPKIKAQEKDRLAKLRGGTK